MTPSLYRDAFLDRVWGPADLDAIAEFWLALYESAAKSSSFTPEPEHRTEIRLRGVPRADLGRVGAELAARAATADFVDPRATHPDDDTISLATRTIAGRDAPPSGLGLPLLAGAEIDGLATEFRLTTADGRRRGASTLVLAGEVRSGSFHLKAIWRAGTTEIAEKTAQYARWESEAAFLAAFDDFRGGGTIPAKLARKLFPTRGADRIASLVTSMVVVPLGEPRLGGLLLRALLFAALFASCGAVGYWGWESGHYPWLLPLAVLVVLIAWFFWHFLRIERHFWVTAYSHYRAIYGKINDESPKLVPAAIGESGRSATDPYARKYTADLIAAGFTLLGEVRLMPASVGEVFGRIFVAPDGSTFLAALFQASNLPEPEKESHFWPAAVSFICHTFLSGGGYAATMNGPAHGYRRKRTGPECLSRVFPNELDPVILAQLHAEAVAGFIAEIGNPPLRHLRFEEYIRRQNMHSEDERRLHSDEPYSWGDHLRWYLQLPRREYRR